MQIVDDEADVFILRTVIGVLGSERHEAVALSEAQIGVEVLGGIVEGYEIAIVHGPRLVADGDFAGEDVGTHGRVGEFGGNAHIYPGAVVEVLLG